ncbi:hypothetical protein BJF78_04110 [Pseudonocardia sp. CNS-139]|nr:hypothetical protein BJF78_04110 [Pseudonocardia sp. CNS-139]
MPGLGHPTHTDGDPRTARLFAVAEQAGLAGVARARFELVRASAERAAGRTLPINVDGAAGVLLTEIGLPWQSARGVALVARAAGLVGHLADERARPTAAAIWAAAEAAAPYRDPAA